VFTFASKQFNLLKIDILMGIYQDTSGDLSLRPTPGLFLISAPNPDDPKVPFGEVIFLPGIFNPASNPDCSSSLFTPGIVSPAVDCFKIANLKPDPTIYLNKFVPMKLPFNLNGLLSPGKLLRKNKSLTLGSTDPNWTTYPLLTLLDFNVDSSLNFILTNDKFMGDLFSPGRTSQVIANQKQPDKLELASTQVLFDPTILRQRDQSLFNMQCFRVDTPLPLVINPQGVQFYALNVPAFGISILPLIVYDAAGNPISNFVVQNAINTYCVKYQSN